MQIPPNRLPGLTPETHPALLPFPLTSPEAHSSSSDSAFAIGTVRMPDLYVEPTTCTALPGNACTACAALSGDTALWREEGEGGKAAWGWRQK